MQWSVRWFRQLECVCVAGGRDEKYNDSGTGWFFPKLQWAYRLITKSWGLSTNWKLSVNARTSLWQLSKFTSHAMGSQKKLKIKIGVWCSDLINFKDGWKVSQRGHGSGWANPSPWHMRWGHLGDPLINFDSPGCSEPSECAGGAWPPHDRPAYWSVDWALEWPPEGAADVAAHRQFRLAWHLLLHSPFHYIYTCIALFGWSNNFLFSTCITVNCFLWSQIM